MNSYKSKRLLMGFLFLGFASVIACDNKPRIRPGLCIEGMPETMSWKKCSEAGKQAVKKGDYLLARKYFLDAVARSEKLGPKDSRFIETLNNLAGVYLKVGDLSHAELILKRLLITDEKGRATEDLALAVNFDVLAKAYQAQGNLVESASALKRVLDIRAKKLGSSHPDVIAVNNELGKLYMEQGRYDEAVLLLSWESCIGEGVKAGEQGDYTKAETFFFAALKKAEKFDPHDQRLVTSLSNMARVHHIQSHFPETEAFLKRIVTIYENGKDLQNANLVSSLNNLASLYMEQKRFPEAEKILKDSIAGVEKDGVPMPLKRSLLGNYAATLQAMSRDQEAEKIIRQYLTISCSLGPTAFRDKTEYQMYCAN